MTPLAITGGVAEGKSTVLRHLATLGAKVWSADEEAARQLARPGVRKSVRDGLGLPREFDKDDLRDALTSSLDARRTLNRLLHAPIVKAMRTANPDVCEIPLLIETCLFAQFDEVWVVTCGPAEQRRRLIERVGSPELADSILATQLPTRVKSSFAHAIMRTDQPFDHVHCVIEDAWRTRLKRLTDGGRTEFGHPR